MPIAIKKPAKVVEGIHGILYGDEKTGKTTSLDDPNMKVLLLDLEGGSAVLAGSETVDVVPIESWEDLQQVGGLLKRNKFIDEEGKEIDFNYDLVAIDSLTRLQDLLKEYIALKYAPNRKREIQGKFGAQSDWGDFANLLQGMVKFFHNLTKQGEKSINVMWIAHKDVVTDDIDGRVTGTKLMIGGKSNSPVIMSIVDAIFYMVKRETEEGLQFGILTSKKGVYNAGVRQSKRQEPLNEMIVSPVWSDIFKTLGYKVNGL
jgi:hypothetical protein